MVSRITGPLPAFTLPVSSDKKSVNIIHFPTFRFSWLQNFPVLGKISVRANEICLNFISSQLIAKLNTGSGQIHNIVSVLGCGKTSDGSQPLTFLEIEAGYISIRFPKHSSVLQSGHRSFYTISSMSVILLQSVLKAGVYASLLCSSKQHIIDYAHASLIQMPLSLPFIIDGSFQSPVCQAWLNASELDFQIVFYSGRK